MPRKKPMQDSAKTAAIVRCSFCRKTRSRGAKLVAGPGVHICEACVALCSRVLTGKPTAAFAGWKSLSDEELLATLPAACAALDAAEDTLHAHVAALRRRGTSWERIAGALGVSRQAAWERFSTES
jgi:hypothetical protein